MSIILSSSLTILSYYIIVLTSLISVVSSNLDLLDLPKESHQLVELTNENLSSYLKAKHFFVFVHCSWCPWSQKMEKTLTKLNLHLKLEPQPFYIGVLDNTIEGVESISYFNSNPISYPQLFYYQDGKLVEKYTGRISFGELFLWVKQRIYEFQPYNISSKDRFDYKLKNAERAFLYFATPEEQLHLGVKEESLDDDDLHGSSDDVVKLKRFNLFKAAAASSLAPACKDILFFYTADKELIEKYNPESNNVFSFFRKGNNTDAYFNSKEKEFSLYTINRYCSKFKPNFFNIVDERTIEKIFIKKNPAIFLFRSVFNNKTEYEELKMQTLSYMKPELNVVITDIDNRYAYKAASLFGVTNDDLPQVRLLDFKGKNDGLRRFSLSKEITSDNILDFFEKWDNNQLHDHNAKASIGKERFSNSPGVMYIPSALFYEKVMLNRKNVIVMFYSEWCGHCKKHLPLFDIVSKRMNQIIYSWVYVDVGDFYDESFSGSLGGALSNLRIDKVPTIILFPSSDKENGGVKYEGDITGPALSKWVLKQVEKKDDL